MKTRQLTYTALFAALGIVVPQAFHMIGGPAIGAILLPMHIPVLVGAMLLGPFSGMVIAMISVLVGALLGMPPMPIAIFMFFELSVYGLVAGVLFKQRKYHVYLSLIVAMIAGRLTQILVIQVFLKLFSATLPPVFGTLAMFGLSIPGMMVQLILVPMLVIFLQRTLKPMEGSYE